MALNSSLQLKPETGSVRRGSGKIVKAVKINAKCIKVHLGGQCPNANGQRNRSRVNWKTA